MFSGVWDTISIWLSAITPEESRFLHNLFCYVCQLWADVSDTLQHLNSSAQLWLGTWIIPLTIGNEDWQGN